MGRKKYRKYKTVTPDVVANLQKIDNLWRRACACCHLGIIGETEAAKDLLRSCHGTDPFFDALISRSLDIQALLLSQPRKPWRRKPWQAPNRLPSLFTTENGENTWLQTAVEEPVVSMAPEQLHWAAEAAQATLSADLIDLVIDFVRRGQHIRRPDRHVRRGEGQTPGRMEAHHETVVRGAERQPFPRVRHRTARGWWLRLPFPRDQGPQESEGA